MNRYYSLALVFVLLAVWARPAVAHVTANPGQAAADSWFRMALRVPHGCDGSATVALAVTIPEGVEAVKPQMKPGWTIEIKRRTLDKPEKGPHGTVVKTVVDQIIWRGGPLPDAYFDEFGLSMKMPKTPGTTLYFPTVQQCEKGVDRWTDIPTKGQSPWDLAKPAPFVTLTKGVNMKMDMKAMNMKSMGGPAGHSHEP